MPDFPRERVRWENETSSGSKIGAAIALAHSALDDAAATELVAAEMLASL